MVKNALPTKFFHLESGKYLLLLLKIFILCSGSFNNDINIILKDGLNAFGINNSDVTNEIAKAFLLIYQEIALTFNSLCQSVNRSYTP